ncbi:BnaAnng24150D, partial [Brassica napus]
TNPWILSMYFVSCLKTLIGYYCINPSCILQSPDVPADVPAAVPADASTSEDKAPEPSLVLLDKNQSTVSDLQKEDARYLEKKDDALALCRAKSDRTRKLARSQKSPYTANRTARVIISNRKLYSGYNPFAPIDKNKLKELAEWLKSCPYYRTALDYKPRKSRTWWYQILRTSLEWLEDCHINAWINVLRKRYNANPQHFRSERMCFLDHLFAQQWRFNFKDFKDSKPDQNGLGRGLPGGAHWFAIWISIPKRHIVVFDSICSSISPEELDVRPTNIPPARADFAKANGKSMRDKMAIRLMCVFELDPYFVFELDPYFVTIFCAEDLQCIKSFKLVVHGGWGIDHNGNLVIT